MMMKMIEKKEKMKLTGGDELGGFEGLKIRRLSTNVLENMNSCRVLCDEMESLDCPAVPKSQPDTIL